MRVLVSDSDSRKGFDIVNIYERLHKLKCVRTAGKDFSARLPLVYGGRIFPLRVSTQKQFNTDFLDIVANYNQEPIVFVPVSERVTRAFYNFKSHNPSIEIRSLLPEESLFEMVSNKYRFQKYCEQNNFNVPRSFEKEDIYFLTNNFIPLIVKPRKGEGSVGIIQLDSKDQLGLLESIDWGNYVVQEKIRDGHKIEGAFFLCSKGEVVSAYSHKRIRTFPEIGGVTVCSETDYNTEIISIGSTLLKSLNWSGLAMIEFLYCQDSRTWKIIELNPRLWGSILLAGFNQSNMLLNYVKLSMGERPEDSSLKTPSYIRWLFPFELMNLVKGKITVGEFFNIARFPTCYINFTYSTFFRSFWFLLYFVFNRSSINRFLKKIKPNRAGI